MNKTIYLIFFILVFNEYIIHQIRNFQSCRIHLKVKKTYLNFFN